MMFWLSKSHYKSFLFFITTKKKQQKNWVITMRTPGDDEQLVLGLLFSENIISTIQDVSIIEYQAVSTNKNTYENTLLVVLKKNVVVNMDNHQRYLPISSACGICGHTSLKALKKIVPTVPLRNKCILSYELFSKMKKHIAEKQLTHILTGGTHSAAVFDYEGNLMSLYEDVGRHNALDKTVGSLLTHFTLPFHNKIVFLSGRISFELIQKTLIAGGRIIISRGPASSLAYEIAEEFDFTLIGFLQKDKMNVYNKGSNVFLNFAM